MTTAELAKAIIDAETKLAQLEIDRYKAEVEAKMAWFEYQQMAYDDRLQSLIKEMNSKAQ